MPLPAAMDALTSGVIITDHLEPDYPIIYCNAAFEKMTGYSPHEIIGHNGRFLQGDDRDQKERDIIRKALANGESCQVEMRNYKKNGTLFWNAVMLSPIKDSEGTITHYIGVQNDITPRREIEISLTQERKTPPGLNDKKQSHEQQENENYLTGVVETIRESLLVLDENLRVLRVNNHFCSFFKVAEAEVIGQQLAELCDGAWNIEALSNLLHNVLPRNNPFEGFELEHDFPYIRRKILLLNARQITLNGKYQKRILLALEDITDWREQERRKDSFITLASHELKTPLTGIKGHLQLLKRKAEKTDDRSYLGTLATVSKSVQRLDSLIDDLLDVAQLQSGKVPFRYSNFKLDELLQECIDSVRGATQTHQIRVTGETGHSITADLSAIEQVILNLLGNAIKYSPGSNEVNVHIKVLDKFVKVSVSDTGIGINPAEQKKIFDRFYRAENIQHYFQGIGIGLYICQQHIKEHQGSIWVESEQGKGSVFSFTVPLTI